MTALLMQVCVCAEGPSNQCDSQDKNDRPGACSGDSSESEREAPTGGQRFASIFELPRRIGEVDAAQYGELPSPQAFHEHATRPLLLHGLARAMPAFRSFVDPTAMAQQLGSAELSVEKGPKLENRRHESVQMTMNEFLQAAAEDTEETSHYVVTSLAKSGASSLVPDLLLPSVLRCGGATEEPMQLNLWVSAGGTRSVLHADALDNVNCVFAGRKRFWIADSVHNNSFQHDACGWTVADVEARAAGDDPRVLGATEVRRRHGYGAFAGKIDVRKIDLGTTQGQCWAEIPWWEADVGPGDCLYIPRNFLHHVHTPTLGWSVAVSWWYERPEEFDAEVGFGCDDDSPLRMSRGFLQ